MTTPLLLLPLLLACGADDPVDPTPDTQDAADIPEMSSTELLTRLSLDLRGVRPSVDELQRVQADPAAVDALLDEYLQDERFGMRLADMWSEIYLTRADAFYIEPAEYGIDDRPGFIDAVGNEGLRMLARIADEDLPWTELVVGDWTMANHLLAQAWPLDYPDGATGWQVAHYTDGRPAAGLLSTNGMWWRYTSTDSNANRGRANQVSRILLCNDYLTHPIDFERNVDLLDEEAVLDAISNNPGCIACHVSLDPLASYLYGFWTYVPDSVVDASQYHPDREQLWASYTDVPPAYYGEAGSSLADLGEQIAADPRFPECAVEQAWELFTRRDLTLADTDHVVAHREAFLAGGLTPRALVRSIVSDPLYRAGATDAVGAVTRKMVTPELLHDQVEGLTGFRWEYGGYDMLGSDLVGVRTLAGGADGATVAATATSPNATLVLVQERLALSAAVHAVVTENELPQAQRTLFTQVDFESEGPADAATVTAQLQHLHLAVLGRSIAADSDEVVALTALFEELRAIEDSEPAAWAGVLAALLRDPDFLLY